MGKRIDTNEFIRRSKIVHGNKYDYSKTHYVRAKDKVCIICPIHGEFWQLPFAHFWKGGGCKKCAMDALTSNKPNTTEEFIKKAKEVHGKKYDYSKVIYKGCFEKVCIICPIHGEFWQTPDCHTHCGGCPKCKGEKIKELKRNTTEEFIEKARKIHNDKYDYTLTEYTTIHNKLKIICPIHGEFMQEANIHLHGAGCPKCNDSILEREVSNSLNKVDIKFEVYKRYDWLKNNLTNFPLSLDFYLPQYNIAIECQGEQHFTIVEHFQGEKGLTERVYRDKLKSKLCKENNVKLIYYLNEKYNKYMNSDEIYFNNVNDLIEYIKSYAVGEINNETLLTDEDLRLGNEIHAA